MWSCSENVLFQMSSLALMRHNPKGEQILDTASALSLIYKRDGVDTETSSFGEWHRLIGSDREIPWKKIFPAGIGRRS